MTTTGLIRPGQDICIAEQLQCQTWYSLSDKSRCGRQKFSRLDCNDFPEHRLDQRRQASLIVLVAALPYGLCLGGVRKLTKFEQS